MLRRLGSAVVKTRLLNDLTQERVAEVAGMSVSFLRRIERGSGNPSYLMLIAIADALEVDFEELMRDAYSTKRTGRV